MAELAEQNVHFGRGPKTAEVICVAIGSANSQKLDVSLMGAMCLTGKHARMEIVGYWRRILLNVALVVVERALVPPGKESFGVFHHPDVEVVEMLMGHDVFNHNEAILVHVSDCLLEVARIEPEVTDFREGGLDDADLRGGNARQGAGSLAK